MRNEFNEGKNRRLYLAISRKHIQQLWNPHISHLVLAIIRQINPQNFEKLFFASFLQSG
jgi:hypothetical protein